MRLYVNENEIPTLKKALNAFIETDLIGKDHMEKAVALYERVDLCEQLQHNVKRAGGDQK